MASSSKRKSSSVSKEQREYQKWLEDFKALMAPHPEGQPRLHDPKIRTSTVTEKRIVEKNKVKADDYDTYLHDVEFHASIDPIPLISPIKDIQKSKTEGKSRPRDPKTRTSKVNEKHTVGKNKIEAADYDTFLHDMEFQALIDPMPGLISPIKDIQKSKSVIKRKAKSAAAPAKRRKLDLMSCLPQVIRDLPDEKPKQSETTKLSEKPKSDEKPKLSVMINPVPAKREGFKRPSQQTRKVDPQNQPKIQGDMYSCLPEIIRQLPGTSKDKAHEVPKKETSKRPSQQTRKVDPQNQPKIQGDMYSCLPEIIRQLPGTSKDKAHEVPKKETCQVSPVPVVNARVPAVSARERRRLREQKLRKASAEKKSQDELFPVVSAQGYDFNFKEEWFKEPWLEKKASLRNNIFYWPTE